MTYIPGKLQGSRGVNPVQLAREMDLTILLPAFLLASIGVAMVYSATFSNPLMAQHYLKQVLWVALGGMALLFFASFNYQVLLQRYAYPSYWLVLVLLAAVLAVGTTIAGSKRWFFLGPVGIQPSEFAKVTTTLVLARFLSVNQDRTGEWTIILGALLLTLAPMLLILREPDLGTALVFIPLVFAMLYTVGTPLRRLLAIVGAGLLASPLLWFVLKDYMRQRIFSFLNPGADSLGSGYNVIQSQIAIGSGGWFGKGWLSGTQGQLRFVPEHHTDFIFSVTCEEWGFLGATVLLLLFAVLLLQMLRVARFARDLGGSLLAIGLTTMLSFQVIVNLGVATGIMPVTGMTLPFISYGGSSMIVCMSMLGICMSVWSGRKVK